MFGHIYNSVFSHYNTENYIGTLAGNKRSNQHECLLTDRHVLVLTNAVR